MWLGWRSLERRRRHANKPHLLSVNSKKHKTKICAIPALSSQTVLMQSGRQRGVKMWCGSEATGRRPAVPAVMVSLSLDVLSSTQLLLWISKRLARPSLGFHSDCRRRGFSLSPTTRNPSVRHWRSTVEPMVSQRT